MSILVTAADPEPRYILVAQKYWLMDGMTSHSGFVLIGRNPPKTPFRVQHCTHWEDPSMSKTELLTFLPKLSPLQFSPLSDSIIQVIVQA